MNILNTIGIRSNKTGVSGDSLRINRESNNYTKISKSLVGHLEGIDNKIGDIVETTLVIVDVPESATSTGTPNQIAFDATHVYICVAEDTWVRASLTTWSS